jgi:hypothetical protein
MWFVHNGSTLIPHHGWQAPAIEAEVNRPPSVLVATRTQVVRGYPNAPHIPILFGHCGLLQSQTGGNGLEHAIGNAVGRVIGLAPLGWVRMIETAVATDDV